MIKMVCVTFGVFSIENVHFEHLLNVKMCLHICAHRTFVSAQKTVNMRSMNAQCLLGILTSHYKHSGLSRVIGGVTALPRPYGQ